jgi:hypothetical protein
MIEIGVYMSYEKLKYEILSEDGPYQIRKYEPFLKMETPQSSDSGFSKLFRYITGHNANHQKIAMTVPVITDLSTQTMSFTMPKDIADKGAPKPLDDSIKLIDEPERFYLSYTFKGSKDLKKTVDALMYYADRSHLEVIGTPKILTYQGPMMPSMFKTYDVIIEIHYETYEHKNNPGGMK